MNYLSYNIAFVSLSMCPIISSAQDKPNIVVLFADDISAREFPIYGSSVWSKPEGGNTSEPEFRADTPVMEQIAREGCWIKNCWAATVSMPSRAQMMTGRYAHVQKWWHNKDLGTYCNEKGKEETWPVYESSPLLIGKITQMAGYASLWAGKTQMPYTEDIEKYGFNEGCYTPGGTNAISPYTDFTMKKVSDGEFKIVDSDLTVKTYLQTSYYWQPSVVLINHPSNKQKMEFWPNTSKARADYGISTYGPDVELNFIFDFMERQHKAGTPFFVYHTSHLGHDANNFINQESKTHWPATPKVTWKNGKYIRQTPKITGDKGHYNTHNSLAQEGIHSHINYLDYQIWLYLQKFRDLGIDKNTVFIICADNGTSRYGKASVDCQKGVHVPMLIYAPCLKMTKKGEQDILMNLADVLPTVAELVGVRLPDNYEVNGVSLLPYLTTSRETHRDWVYAYRSGMQLIRGNKVLRDGKGVWYDVSINPDDLISFPVITDWKNVSAEHRAERNKLNRILPEFDLYKKVHNGPGGTFMPGNKRMNVQNKKR